MLKDKTERKTSDKDNIVETDRQMDEGTKREREREREKRTENKRKWLFSEKVLCVVAAAAVAKKVYDKSFFVFVLFFE